MVVPAGQLPDLSASASFGNILNKCENIYDDVIPLSLPYVMSLANDYQSNLRIKLQIFASLCRPLKLIDQVKLI